MKKIEPLSGAKLSSVRQLLQKKIRLERRQFLVEGLRSVEELLLSDWDITMVVVTKEFLQTHHATFESLVASRNIPVHYVSSKAFATISDTEHAQGILAVAQQKRYSMEVLEQMSSGFVVAVDGVAEPGNLGVIIRTADWFGIDAVVVSKQSVELFNPKVVRSTVGSLFHLPIIVDEDMDSAVVSLKRKGFRIYATVVEGGEDITQIRWGNKRVCVVGSEAHGVSESIRDEADTLVKIPRFGKAESLNVSVACGVILAHSRLMKS